MGAMEGSCCLLHAFMMVLNYSCFFQYWAVHCTVLVPVEKESEGEGTGLRAKGGIHSINQYLSEMGVIAALWCDLLR